MPLWTPTRKLVIVTGSYVGNDSDDRQISTGFKCSKVIIIAGGWNWIVLPGVTTYFKTGGVTTVTDALLHASNGFVVDQINANGSATGGTYYYWAISG